MKEIDMWEIFVCLFDFVWVGWGWGMGYLWAKRFTPQNRLGIVESTPSVKMVVTCLISAERREDIDSLLFYALHIWQKLHFTFRWETCWSIKLSFGQDIIPTQLFWTKMLCYHHFDQQCKIICDCVYKLYWKREVSGNTVLLNEVLFTLSHLRHGDLTISCPQIGNLFVSNVFITICADNVDPILYIDLCYNHFFLSCQMIWLRIFLRLVATAGVLDCHIILCFMWNRRENSPVTQTTAEPTLLS